MKHFCLKCGKELKENQLLCPKCGSCSFFDAMKDIADDKLLPGLLNAVQIEETMQWVKYRCGNAGSTGHGFTAEDANNLSDLYQGLNPEIVGKNNMKGGPDRKVGDIKIQCKYYATPEKTLDSLFNDGSLKYSGQVAEVPSDQYDEIVSLLQKRIANGEIAGLNDPKEASLLVKRGSVSYKQAKNLQRAGNIDSLKFDAATGAITATGMFGISFVVSLCCNLNDGLTIDDAVQLAFVSGIKSGTITLTSSI
ncbi:MAG: zinc ribbon domain-containing protein, partial [Paramuribaculum sp.]|nr:zinc ribbon domain-containing protein [Paramuribaculum sp.]